MGSRSLGTLTIDLVAKTGAFSAGMSKAERETAKSSRAMQKQMDDLRKSAVRVGAVLGTAIVGATALIIKNTMDAAREQAQLAAVLKSTGGAAGLTAQQLNAMADAFQQNSTFAAGAVTDMQSVLLTFKEIKGTTFERASQSILDLATRMGTDLQGAAVQVGKALDAPITGIASLTRVGVRFNEEQKALIKTLVETGNVADAQAIILKELESQFGGSAQAASQTLGGALTILKNNFNDLLEGDSGGDGVRGATQAVQDLAALLKSPQVQEGFSAIINGAFTATAKIAQLTAGIANLTKTVAEQLAANVGGIGGDDIARLEAQATKLRERLKEQQDRFVLIDIGKNEAKIEADLKKVEAQIRSFYERSAQAASGRLGLLAAPPGAQGLEDGGSTVINAGADFGADRATGALKGRSSAAKEAAAALRELAKAEKIEQEAARALAERLYEQRKELRDLAIEEARQKEEALAPGRALVDNLKFELELLKMTNAERAMAVQLRGMDAEAIKLYGDEIAALNAQIEQNIQVAEGMDVVRDATRGLFSDLMDGSKSAKDAFKDFVDSILDGIAQIVARNLTESLFGSFGSSGGGASGGLLGSLFGSFFGGARAGGGPVYPGKAFLVGENGPEMFVPSAAGTIATAGQTARMGGGTTNVTFVLPGRNDIRTEAQRQVDLARATQRQLQRGTA